MLYNQFFRSRRLSLIFALVILVLILNRWRLNSTNNNSARAVNRLVESLKINKKIVEIVDRQPTFKLYVYEGYEPVVDRNRAQAKLLDNIKLHDKCQQNPKLIVVDIGASLGIILSERNFRLKLIHFRTIWSLCCCVWLSSLYV